MKFSKNTLLILNNFSTIQKNLTFRQGNHLRTIDDENSVIAEAILDNDIPQDFGIHDLKNFLNTLNIFNDPTIEFFEDKITIKEDNVEYDYYRASDNVLKGDPFYNKRLNLPEKACEFTITKEQLKNIIKASNVLKSLSSSNTSGIRFYKDDENNIVVEARFYKDEPAKNVYRLILGKCDENICDFDVIVDSRKLTLIEDDYKICLYQRKCLTMQGLNYPVTYIIAYGKEK